MIDTEKNRRNKVDQAVLIGIEDKNSRPGEALEHLQELEELTANLDIPVADRFTVKLKTAHAQYYVGSGKAGEIVERARQLNADCLIFDNDLTPSQQRNWERFSQLCVIDRQEVILDIFARRASTREAVLQVELARMEYSLPRLTRAWTHLSRQRGGAMGTRGEGEKQIEVDRRMVQQRITALERELAEVRKQRDTQRKSRSRHGLPQAAIVGYTNAGKSSLLNFLSGANVLVEDKLFATLDPTTKKITLPDQRELLLTDTVGFVRKLPHALVDAFKSTLEEAALADFLILVLDISSPYVEEHWETTLSVLRELGAQNKNIITVFNKIDLQEDPQVYARIKNMFSESVFISTLTGAGADSLNEALLRITPSANCLLKLKLPPSRHDLASMAHARGQVLFSEYDDEGNLLLTVNINSALKSKFEEYCEN